MGDRSLVQIPPPTMRTGVLEPLRQDNCLLPGRDKCLPLQAVIVKNGRIFIDSIESADDGINDENRQLEQEIDNWAGDDDDDDFMNNSKFSQESFDLFMSSNDSDDDLGDIFLQNEQTLNGDKQSSINCDFQQSFEGLTDTVGPKFYQSFDGLTNMVGPKFYQSFDGLTDMVDPKFYQSFEGFTVGPDVSGDVFRGQDKGSLNGNSEVQHGCPGADVTSKMAVGRRRRDSLNLEEYTTFDEHVEGTFDEHVERLLSQDVGSNWRYVPLYPYNYHSREQEVQRASVISDLPILLRDNPTECMRRVVPKILKMLHVEDVDMQLVAATTFLQILDMKLVCVDQYKNTFLQTILSSVDSMNQEVADAWMDTLLSCVDLLPVEVIKSEVLPTAVNKGQLCNVLRARLSCCKILAHLSSKFENSIIKNDILPVVLSLCGDVEHQVRACMCQRLDVVACGLGLEMTKSQLLPQLIELSEDESHSVLSACLETTANIIDILDQEANVHATIPMVKELLRKAFNHEETTLLVASRLLGRICHSLSGYMNMEDKAYFLEYFKKLCTTGLQQNKSPEETLKEETVSMSKTSLYSSVETRQSMTETSLYSRIETRRNAAYNFPAMVHFIEGKEFHSELYSCFSQLCRDSQPAVSRTMAAGFHEVAKLLGIKVTVVFPELNYLLNSSDIGVLKVLMANFQDIMSAHTSLGYDQFTDDLVDTVEDVVSNFLKAESVVFSSPCWRTQEAMLKSIDCLHLLCSSDYIYNKVLPLLMDKLRTGRALPVKVAAAMATTKLCRNLKYKAQREEVVQAIIEEFHGSKSCYKRSLFIDLARCYLRVNSKQSFKDRFYQLVLNMKLDPVATVRLKMLTVFPELKQSLVLPRDQNLCKALDAALQQIMLNDKDKDVKQAASQISDILAGIQETNSDSLRASTSNVGVEEDEDLKKEIEENEKLAMEEKEKKDDDTKASMDEKRNFINCGRGSQSKIPATRGNCGSLKAPMKGCKGSAAAAHQTVSKQSLSTSTSVNTSITKVGRNGLPLSKCRTLCLTKSKSTTCIPSLIPRLEQRPSTPTKKEPVRRIPVLISNKTASTPALMVSVSDKKSPSPTPPTRKSSSPTPITRKNQPNIPTTTGTASIYRKSSLNILSMTSSEEVGSVALVGTAKSDTIKVKLLNDITKPSGCSMVAHPTRVPKKAFQ